MKSSPVPRVKICCILSKQEAWMAIEHGAAAIGLVSEMPGGPGVISLNRIAEIASVIPPSIGTFLLTSKTTVKKIIEQHHYCRTNTIQICDRLTEGTHSELKNALPGISIVQVVHISGKESIDEAITVSTNVDAILLDSGIQGDNIKELGGTGRVHNWHISKQIRQQISIPLFLAGGLNPKNISDAIKTVQPFGVDICSGVRTCGKLDVTKLRDFFSNIRQLDQSRMIR